MIDPRSMQGRSCMKCGKTIKGDDLEMACVGVKVDWHGRKKHSTVSTEPINLCGKCAQAFNTTLAAVMADVTGKV